MKDGIMYSDRLPGTAAFIIPYLAYADLIQGALPEHTKSKPDYYFIAASILPNLAGVIGLFLLFILCYHLFSFDFRLSLTMTIICGLATLYHLESTHIYSHIISLVGVYISYHCYFKREKYNELALELIPNGIYYWWIYAS